jgi:hypothetical protein
MKSVNLRKWLSVAALAFVMAVLSLQFQSARAQYGYDPSLSNYTGVSSTMIERGGFLYIVQGGMVYKVRTKDMAVVGRTVLKSPFTVYPTATPDWNQPTATPTAVATYTPEPVR